MFYVFGALVFLAVTLAAAGWLLHQGGASARAIRDRLRRFAGRGPIAPTVSVERDERYSSIRFLDAALRRLELGQRLDLLLYQAGLGMRAGMLVLLVASFGMLGYFVGLAATHRVAPGLVGLALLGPAPYLWVLHRKNVRMKAFAEEFPDIPLAYNITRDDMIEENRDLLVLVTDTPHEGADESLQRALAEIPALDALGLVAGVGDAAIDGGDPGPGAGEEGPHDPA